MKTKLYGSFRDGIEAAAQEMLEKNLDFLKIPGNSGNILIRAGTEEEKQREGKGLILFPVKIAVNDKEVITFLICRA